MVHSTRAREPRLSSKKPYFPNRRSAVISIAVVISLLAFAVLAIDRNNVNRLTKYEKQAILAQEEVRVLMEDRFLYAEALVNVLGNAEQAKPVSDAIRLFDKEGSVDDLGTSYRRLDEELSILQPSLFRLSEYPLYQSYFEQLYAIEQELVAAVAQYHEKATYYNVQKHGFPALLVARRLEMEDLELLNLGTALKGRP